MASNKILLGCFLYFFALPGLAEEMSDRVLYLYASRADKQEFGTGFFIDPDGTFVTAYHVIYDANGLKVYGHNSELFSDVQLIIADPTNDIAILTVNHAHTPFFKLTDQTLQVGKTFMAIGHPRGFRDQAFEAHATQTGFADSLQLSDSSGNPVFSKSIAIIPLDLTIYGGMSGGPIVNSDGGVVGMLTGSYSEGGSLAWGIPSKTISQLITPLPRTRTDLSKVTWHPMESYSSHFRSFSITRGLSASETLDWLNTKWKDKGIKELDVNGFTAHINIQQTALEQSDKTLKFTIVYSLIGDNYRTRIIVSLEDAYRATARSNDESHFVRIYCPKERSCVWLQSQKQGQDGWLTLEEKKTDEIALNYWSMEDADSATRAATAINHLIHLYGGPVSKEEAFGDK